MIQIKASNQFLNFSYHIIKHLYNLNKEILIDLILCRDQLNYLLASHLFYLTLNLKVKNYFYLEALSKVIIFLSLRLNEVFLKLEEVIFLIHYFIIIIRKSFNAMH
jgi:hypothetical protein